MAYSSHHHRYPILSRRDTKSGLALILDVTGEVVASKGLRENLKLFRKYFTSINLRVHEIRICSEKQIRSSLQSITNPLPHSQGQQGLPNSRLLKEDSLCVIGIIARGDETYSCLSNGKHIKDIDIERFMNEDYCTILRGKPKLFLYLKYFTKIPDEVTSVDLTPTKFQDISTDDETDGDSYSSTNLNMLSYYIYDFGLELLQTETSGSLSLYNLLQAFKRYGADNDIVTFLKIFLGEMTKLQNELTKVNDRSYPSICIMMRNRLRRNLFLSQLREQTDEEQDLEGVLSDNLHNQCEVSSTPTVTKYQSHQIQTHQIPHPVSSVVKSYPGSLRIMKYKGLASVSKPKNKNIFRARGKVIRNPMWAMPNKFRSSYKAADYHTKQSCKKSCFRTPQNNWRVKKSTCIFIPASRKKQTGNASTASTQHRSKPVYCTQQCVPKLI